MAHGDQPPLVLEMPRYKGGEGLSLHVLSNLDILVPKVRYFSTRYFETRIEINQFLFPSSFFVTRPCLVGGTRMCLVGGTHNKARPRKT